MIGDSYQCPVCQSWVEVCDCPLIAPQAMEAELSAARAVVEAARAYHGCLDCHITDDGGRPCCDGHRAPLADALAAYDRITQEGK